MTTTNRRQWALITGVSAGGLGGALTSELLSRGINVIAAGLAVSDLDYLKPTGSAELKKLQLDVTSSDSIAAAVTESDRITNGKLDFLFNNAGYGYMTPLLDADISRIEDNFAVNVFGVMKMTQAFFPLLRAAQGVIVNQGSIAGLSGIGQPFIGSYSASKCAMMSFSDTLRLELSPFGVRVVTLVTGDVRTGFWEHANKGAPRKLSEGSLYRPIAEQVEAMMRGDTNPSGQHAPERWARAVVDDLTTKSTPPSAVRRGHLATIMWLVSLLVPQWILTFGFIRSAKLNDLSTFLRGQEATKRR